MPSRRLVLRNTCSAINAFDPSAALVAAFLHAPKCRFSRAPIREKPERQEHDLLGLKEVLEDSIQIRRISKGDQVFRKHSLHRTPVDEDDDVAREPGESGRDNVFRKTLHLVNSYGKASQKGRSLARHEQAKGVAATNPALARRLNAQNDNLEAMGGPQAQMQSLAELGRFSLPAEHWSSKLVIDPANSRSRNDVWKRKQQDLAKTAHELSKLKVSPSDTKQIQQGQSYLEYTGWYIDVPNSPMSAPMRIPWLSSDHQTAGQNAVELLDSEIESFARWMDCTPMETIARTALAQNVTRIINNSDSNSVNPTNNDSDNNVTPVVDVKQFGSDEVGLATILSDIDIRVSIRGQSTSIRRLTREIEAIKTVLWNDPDFQLVLLRRARYPILNTQHKQTGIDIQIVASPDTNAQCEAMTHYLDTIPQLRSVYMVLKTALGIRGLVDVFNGGIGSYGLFMMLAASLKRPLANPPRTAGESLLRFLDFYSDLDMEKYGVSVSPPKLFKKHDVFTTDTKSHIAAATRRGDPIRAAQWAIGQRRIYQPYLFCLQDPANPTNDLGRKSNAIKHLQTTIRVFRNTLRKYLSDGFPSVQSAPWVDGSLLLPLVGRCHEIYHERRARAEAQGRIAVEAQKEAKEMRVREKEERKVSKVKAKERRKEQDKAKERNAKARKASEAEKRIARKAEERKVAEVDGGVSASVEQEVVEEGAEGQEQADVEK